MIKILRKKKIGYWAFITYPPDLAIYAVCQCCGFTIGCSHVDTSKGFKVVIDEPYNFCPNCGKKMELWNDKHVYNKDGELIK